ncbi:helix-turn-helix domain-containing protein [Morganella morganii]|uniref:helix-turn-helix domain-containing protein n=1 Tax=Morganella morganii TaxID=582 RepID=UPI0023674C98|nr:helix-turn-helix transcriptional regulator [Morganella morganii]
MKDINLITGQNIRSLRCRNGMTTRNLADRLGISSRQISRYEQGINKIDASIVFKIINIFDVPYEFLFPEPEVEDFTQTKNSLMHMDPSLST